MLWRVSPKRSRRRPPTGFIIPAQPMLVAKPRPGPQWIHEVKHDGYRLLASKAGDRVTLWTRYGTDFTDRLPAIAEAVRSLPADNALLDGEAVVFRPDGHSDFVALLTKHGGERASFVAFDVLQVDGEDQRKLPLEVRRAELEALVAGQAGIHCSARRSRAAGELVFAKACAMGLEGIVSKRLGSPYSSGRCRSWLKIKNPAFARE
jgi:bifunctional non-homologous end joining protein LigD